MLDLRAKIASNNVIKQRVLELLERYGKDVILTLFTQLFEYSEQRLRRKLASIPDGEWTAENHVEGVREPFLTVEIKITKSGETLTMDFTGSSPQTSGSENIGALGAMSSAMNPLLTTLCHDLPWNEGLFKPIEFILPERSIVNPKRPAAVSANTPSGGNILVMTTAHRALSKMLLESDGFADEACGNIGASFNNFVLAGIGRNGKYFATLILDGLAGGVGGFIDSDGESSAQNHWAVKTMISNVETIEMIYPFLYLWRREIPDSGGAGRFRGGLGTESALMPWGTEEVVQVNLGVGQEPRTCLGLVGGYPSVHSPVGIIRGSTVRAAFAEGRMPSSLSEMGGLNDPGLSKGVSTFGPNDVLHAVVGSGGGGFGDPILRDPLAVLRDLQDGSVSMLLATDTYGVIFSDGPKVDREATEARRTAQRQERLSAASSSDFPPAPCVSCGRAVTPVLFDGAITLAEPPGMGAYSDNFALRHVCCSECGELLDVFQVRKSLVALG